MPIAGQRPEAREEELEESVKSQVDHHPRCADHTELHQARERAKPVIEHSLQLAQIINANAPSDRELVTYGGPPIPIAPALDDAAIKRVIGNLASTPLEAGVTETMRRFSVLRDAGRLDTSDIDAELTEIREKVF